MSAILYPVAANAEAALSRPLGRAVRQREAGAVAGEAVEFVTEAVGPAFATQAAARAAYAGRVDDAGAGAAPAAEDRYCRLAELVVGAAAPGPVQPTFEGGRRWPAAHPPAPRTAWRLQVSYWRIAGAERPLEAPQARRARRSREAARLDAASLRAMARQPLRAVEPQQPLDIGLFEARLPEAPHIIVPDE
jgi:hypothetical protein